MLLFYDIVIVKLFCDNVIMRREEQYCMTESEMQKLVVINKVIDGTLTASEAAQVLDLSVRQIFRLKKGVKEQGASF
ncbi:MAG: Integrase catalytic region [Mahella sp.]|nr:Integrase catalytic region [Mahella sp.]